eukprot:Sdes_comp19867_c0_seq1m12138
MRRVYSTGNRLSDITLEEISPARIGLPLSPNSCSDLSHSPGITRSSSARCYLTRAHSHTSKFTDDILHSPTIGGSEPRFHNHSNQSNSNRSNLPSPLTSFNPKPLTFISRSRPLICACKWRCLPSVAILLLLLIFLFTMEIIPVHYTKFFQKSSSNMPNDLQYGVVIDAGSSGSRVYLYQWPRVSTASSTPFVQITSSMTKENLQVMKKVEPGLSSYQKNPPASTAGISELLMYVMKHIPDSKIPTTPLYIMATAG